MPCAIAMTSTWAGDPDPRWLYQQQLTTTDNTSFPWDKNVINIPFAQPGTGSPVTQPSTGWPGWATAQRFPAWPPPELNAEIAALEAELLCEFGKIIKGEFIVSVTENSSWFGLTFCDLSGKSHAIGAASLIQLYKKAAQFLATLCEYIEA